MTAAFDPLERLPLALHPLAMPPSGPGWNLEELRDLLPDPGLPLRPASVLIALVERASGLNVILTRRTEALRHHAGQVSFPGGRIEASDVDPVAAALREADEEIGLSRALATPLGYLDPFATITGFHVYPVVARVCSAFIARRDPSEVDEVFEAPLDFLLDSGNARKLEVDYRGRKRALVEFRYEGHHIWGATAAMIVNLRERLERA